MNIAFLSTRSDAVGGAQVHVRDLCLALQGSGHEVVVLLGGEGPVTDDFRTRGIPYRSLKFLDRPINPFRDGRALLEVRAALRDVRPDLLSAHSAKARWLGGVAARGLGTRVLFTAHGWPFADGVRPKAAFAYRLAERTVAPFARRIITVSEYDRRLALAYRVAPPEKLITVHNGMPTLGRDYLATPAQDPPRLVMVARFEAQKDHATLLRALAELKAHLWQLDLVGDGPLMGDTRALAHQLGLDERVRFLGARRDVAALLSAAQIFLLVSNWEGFPRSILEAMRAGLPVVASNVGGVAEAVLDGETGLLVARGDAPALRRSLERLLGSPTTRAQFGQSGLDRFQNHFTFGRMLEKTESIYRDILE